MHSANPGWEPGNYWMECDRCGFDRRKDEMREEWTGLWVCGDKCWEPRHPQDFLRGREDKQQVPVARPANIQNSHTAGSITADDL